MKLSIKQGSENYAATIVEIDKVYTIPTADNLHRTVVFGNDVIISKDVKVGDKMIYFCSGTKLNPDFCKFNNLYEDKTLNLDPEQKGYISSKCRVKAVKLRGVVSDGFLLPLDSLEYVYMQIKLVLNIGDTFTDIGNYSICEKYVISTTGNSNSGGKESKSTNKLKELLVKDQFRLHTDTAHFAKNLHKFEPSDNIVITRKYHGTSGISSHVLIQRNLSLIERLLSWFGVNIPKTEYGYIYSSGKPKSGLPKGIFSGDESTWNNNNKSFYSENYWLKAFNKLKPSLEKGITLYYEIVGEGIQGKDYTYGFEHEIFVYRITQTNVDGIVYEFSWQQVKDYCEKYNINYVSEYRKCTYLDLKKEAEFNSEDIIQTLTVLYLNKSYGDCKVDEGICIRNERTNEIFKLKSPNFILAENNNAEIEEINIEDEQ